MTPAEQEGLAVMRRLYSSEAIYGRADLRPFMLAKLRAVEAAQTDKGKPMPDFGTAFGAGAGGAVSAALILFLAFLWATARG